MLQDLLGVFAPGMRNIASIPGNVTATGLCVAFWGYFLYQGVTDPLGGVNTLWPLFGISNQMLAAIALMLCTVVLFKMKRERYAFVTVLPTAWLVICTLTAGLQKVFDSAPSVSFLAHANIFRAAADAGKVLAPAKNLDEMRQIVLNDTIDAVMAFIFVLLVASMIYFGVRACIDAWRASGWTARELPEATNGPQVAVPAE
jgi:carbon starvation protein